MHVQRGLVWILVVGVLATAAFAQQSGTLVKNVDCANGETIGAALRVRVSIAIKDWWHSTSSAPAVRT